MEVDARGQSVCQDMDLKENRNDSFKEEMEKGSNMFGVYESCQTEWKKKN